MISTNHSVAAASQTYNEECTLEDDVVSDCETPVIN